MNNTPEPLNRGVLSKATLVAVGLATLGIVLFVVLWVVLGDAGVDQFARLMIALCIPPALIAAVIGVVILVQGGSAGSDI